MVDPKILENENQEENGCFCGGEASLGILKDVQRLYEKRLEMIERSGGSQKMQKQIDILRRWVSDLVAQNSLLASTVERLEQEATARTLQRNRHDEMVTELRIEVSALRRRLARKDSDLQGLIEVLRRLREFDYCTLQGIHFFEVSEEDIFGPLEREWTGCFLFKFYTASTGIPFVMPFLVPRTKDSGTVRHEGLAALYKGFIPAWFRMGPWNIIFFVTYEQLKQFY